MTTKDRAPSRTLPRFLLVDDLAKNLLALEAVLRREDVELHKATSGREALELLLDHDYALAIIDVHMPEMDGFELAEFMRGNERTRRIPIIFVTAAGRDAVRRFQGYEAGAVDFLFKPLDTRVLRHKVEVFVELYRQRAEIAETLRLNEEMVAIVTHDLRSPLASMFMVAQALAERTEDEFTHKQATRIRSTCEQLMSSVNDLLDLSRARLAGGIPVERDHVDLASIAENVHRNVTSAHPTRAIELTQQGTNFRGHWDGEGLERVLTNLLGNAVAHGRPDSRIDVELMDRGEEVAFAVRNEGVISDEALPGLFEPFKQRTTEAKRKKEGLGLGLYIVERIVAAHSGNVGVKSSDGHTTFQVTLPRQE